MIKLKPGTLFAGRYEAVRLLSAGGMGAVYEVIHRETKRHRALKVMLPHVLEDDDMRSRFALEAVVTAEIESEALVEIFDAGIDTETDSPFIVMELLRGEDVAARLSRGQRYTPAEVRLVVEQIARALEKTHARGIVHRDLKPENLFLSPRDDGSVRVKVLDFGIAKLIKTTTSGAPKTTRSFGTPYYVPAEQLTGDARLIGPSSDLYSLAHIVFTMLVGVPYFADEAQDGGNVLALLLAVGKGVQEPPCARAKRRGLELPPAFDGWFMRATALDPKLRFGDATALVRGLAEVFPGVDAASTIALGSPRDSVGEAPPVEGPSPVSLSARQRALETRVEADTPASSAQTPSGRDGPTREVLVPPSGGARSEAGSSQGFATFVTEPDPRRKSRKLMAGAGALLVLGVVGVAARALLTAPAEPAPASAAEARIAASSTSTATATTSDTPHISFVPPPGEGASPSSAKGSAEGSASLFASSPANNSTRPSGSDGAAHRVIKPTPRVTGAASAPSPPPSSAPPASSSAPYRIRI